MMRTLSEVDAATVCVIELSGRAVCPQWWRGLSGPSLAS